MTDKTIRLGLTNISVSKSPILEFVNDTWRVWTSYNPTLTKGTFIELGKDGSMTRHTINIDDSVSIAHI